MTQFGHMVTPVLVTIFFLNTTPCFSSTIPFSESDVGHAILYYSNKFNIDPKILFVLSSIESDFKPLAISIETTPNKAVILKQLASKNIRVKSGKTFHSKLALVTLYPKNYDTAVFIIKHLKELGFTFDVGLMQINTCNFSLHEAEEMLEPNKNILKASAHFNTCQHEFSKNLKYQVECYNRGAGNLKRMLRKGGRYFPYWSRFQKRWKLFFD